LQNGARWPAPWPTLDSTNFLRKAWSHRRRLHVVYGLFFAKWRTLACAMAYAGLHQFPPKGMVASKTATRCLRLVFRKMAHAGLRRGQRWTPPISSQRHGRIEDCYMLFTDCFSQNGARWPAPWLTLDSTNFLRKAWSHRRLLHVVYGLFFAKWRTLASAVANAGLHQFPPNGKVVSKTATRCLRLVFRKMAHAGQRRGQRWTPPISSERHGRIEDGYTLFTACFSQNGARWPAPRPTLDSTNFLRKAWSHRRRLHVVYGLFFAKWRTLASAVANAGLHQFPPKGMVASKTATRCLRLVFRKMAHAGQRRGQRWTPPISSDYSEIVFRVLLK
jgi:ribosomal protein S14